MPFQFFDLPPELRDNVDAFMFVEFEKTSPAGGYSPSKTTVKVRYPSVNVRQTNR
jgi:hypothetical protein